MKEHRLNVRISEKRLNKVRRIAGHRDITITQLVQDWIDTLAEPEEQIAQSDNSDEEFENYLNDVIDDAPVAYGLDAFDIEAAMKDMTLMLLFSKQKKLQGDEKLEVRYRTLNILEAKYLNY